MLYSPSQIQYTFNTRKGFKTTLQILKNLTTPLVADEKFFCEENDVNTNRLLKTFQIAPNCHSGHAPSF